MAVSKQPSITSETSSGEGLDEEPTLRGEVKWKRFHPLRVVRKIFRRRIKRGTGSGTSKKSWSTSELQSVQDDSAGKCDVPSPLKIGFSVSHDSIFTPENNSSIAGNESPEISRPSSISVCQTSMKIMLKDSTRHSSGDSSSVCLNEQRSVHTDCDLEGANPVPLNHTAAHHKISVRPKRTHGLPRRHIKQVDVTKVASLPSTSELTKDVNKCVETVEVSETVKSSECTIVTSFESPLTPESRTEKVFLNSASVSSSEKSYFTSEFREGAERHFHEQAYVRVETVKTISNTDVKLEPTEYTVEKYTCEGDTIDDKDNTRQYQNTVSCMFPDSKQNPETKYKDDKIIDNNKPIKPALEDNGKCDSQVKIASTTEDATVTVCSLAKNITKSESFSSKEIVDVKACSEKKLDYIETKQDKNLPENELKCVSELKPTLQFNITDGLSDKNSNTLFDDIQISPLESTNKSPKSSTIADKLDIDCEFVLKPIKKDRKLSSDSELSLKDTLMEVEKSNCLMPSVYQEEESIMTNKSCLVGIDEQLFASHQTSYNNDLTTILVSEANTSASADKKHESCNITIQGAIPNKEKNASEQIISCMKDTASTIHTPHASVIDDKRMSEDKTNKSIESKLEGSKLAASEVEGRIYQNPVKKPCETKPDSTQVVTSQPLKQVGESHLPDASSNVSIKNINCEKRVSVEIVPFSQRMKERKYQPVSPANKESSEKKSSTFVDSRPSDHEILENKDISSNRHSFPGSITSETKNADYTTTVKEANKEKVQYPVQIRIHKSNPTLAKDKNSVKQNDASETKPSKNERQTTIQHHPTPKRITQHDIKHLKEETTGETLPKWEIKIQPAASQTRLADEKTVSVKSSIHKNEYFKPNQSGISENKDVPSETSLSRSQGNSRKLAKDSSILSHDPEPELLQVFARRSIKQKHCDKDKGEKINFSKPEKPDSASESLTSETPTKKKDKTASLSSIGTKTSENTKLHISKSELRKKSKSFCEKEKVPRSASPLKEMNLIHRDRSSDDSHALSDTHSQHRLSKTEESLLTLPFECEKRSTSRTSQNDSIEDYPSTHVSKEEHPLKSNSISTPPSTSVNGNFNLGVVKESPGMIAGKDALTPSWLQIAQQRRELREQRERLLLGGSPNSLMDGSSKPSRSSKVWDMVNNFQKLQMT